MRVLFIDDRQREIERLVDLSGVGRVHVVEIHIFTTLDHCWWTVHDFDPTVILIGHGLSVYPITGSDVIRHLRSQGVKARFVGNSGGGMILFENDGIEIEGSVDRHPSKLAALLLA
jgi:hypothetical protein